MNSQDETIINSSAILDAISSLRQEINVRFNSIGVRLRHVEDETSEIKNRLLLVEREITEVKNLNVSFDVRIDRLEAIGPEALNLIYNTRADVKVLRAEVTAWTRDVMDLQRKAA